MTLNFATGSKDANLVLAMHAFLGLFLAREQQCTAVVLQELVKEVPAIEPDPDFCFVPDPHVLCNFPNDA